MTRSRNILPPRIPFGPEEDTIIRALFPVNATWEVAKLIDRTAAQVWNRARRLGVKKSPEYLASKAYRFNGSEQRSKVHRFPKGHVPANKGLRRPGFSPGRMAQTQFKKGHRSGRAVKLYQPIGTERISKDGYRERKVNDDMPLQSRWVAVHRIVWEAANGPVPDGHCLAFRDGNKKHIELSNLELITRAERMRRNTIHNLPESLKSTVRALGYLRRRINRESRREKQD